LGNVADRLEVVSIKGCCYALRWSSYERATRHPIPQAGLVKFARRARSLRRLRSDLTPDNAAVLRGERPDVAFVA
jgi:hypothetical protein